MAKEFLTDLEVEQEIERLLESNAVKVAKAEKQMLYRRRQYMYTLRWMEKRGKELLAQGKTVDDFKGNFDEEE